MEDIRSYYDRFPEEMRLASGTGQLEARRTKDLIHRFAPEPSGTLLDVGGGAGAYSFWLAHRGWSVHLLDASPRLVALARERDVAAGHRLESIEEGDARILPFPDRSARCVLLLGPLYHLTEPADRGQVLAEAERVLEPGGLLFAACISRWASLFDAMRSDRLAEAEPSGIVDVDLQTGQHRNPTGDVGLFTTAYLHHPDEFEEELRATGLNLLGIFGLEGPGWLMPDFDERWADPDRRHSLMRTAEAIEREPHLLGLSAHLLGVMRK